MSEYSEEAYFEGLVSHRIQVFLINGVCLRGRLEGASELAIFLSDESTVAASQLVFKSSIATVSLEKERQRDERADVANKILAARTKCERMPRSAAGE